MAPLFLLFLVLPFAELAVIVASANAIGLGPTFVALVGFSLLGGWMMRREGWSVWRRAGDELAAGRMPARELVDGLLVLLGGALLLTPGFITDAVGLLLILPPTRALLRPLLLRRLQSRLEVTVVGGSGFTGGFSGGFGFPGSVVDAEAHEADGRRAPSARVVRVEADEPEALGPGN